MSPSVPCVAPTGMSPSIRGTDVSSSALGALSETPTAWLGTALHQEIIYSRESSLFNDKFVKNKCKTI